MLKVGEEATSSTDFLERMTCKAETYGEGRLHPMIASDIIEALLIGI